MWLREIYVRDTNPYQALVVSLMGHTSDIQKTGPNIAVFTSHNASRDVHI